MSVFFCFTGNCVSVKQKKIICPAERPLRVLGDGRFENGRRVTAKPFSCIDGRNYRFGVS